jgi:hypothetical protein
MAQAAPVKGLIRDILRKWHAEAGQPLADQEEPKVPAQTLIAAAIEILKDGKLTQSDYEPLAVACEELFDEVVRPFDIPNIGPILENLIEDGMKAAIRPLLKKAFDRYVA